jgi:hypothetical protein
MKGFIYCHDPLYRECITETNVSTLASVLRAMVFAQIQELTIVTSLYRAGVLYEIAARHLIPVSFYFGELKDIITTPDLFAIAIGEKKLPIGAFKQFYVPDKPQMFWGSTNLLMQKDEVIAATMTDNIFHKYLANNPIQYGMQQLKSIGNLFEVKGTV